MLLDKHSRSVLYFLVSCIFSVTTVRCQNGVDNFQMMTIDTNTLSVKLDGPLPLISPSPDHDFYQRFSGNTISIAHLGPDGSNISYNAFDLDRDGRLMTRNKMQVLMQGPFGTVFANSTYYYGKEYNHAPTDFHVELYFNLMKARTNLQNGKRQLRTILTNNG